VHHDFELTDAVDMVLTLMRIRVGDNQFKPDRLRIVFDEEQRLFFSVASFRGRIRDNHSYRIAERDLDRFDRNDTFTLEVVRWTPSVGQESGGAKRESRRVPIPLPIRGDV
jgi:hypothetical protein